MRHGFATLTMHPYRHSVRLAAIATMPRTTKGAGRMTDRPLVTDHQSTLAALCRKPRPASKKYSPNRPFSLLCRRSALHTLQPQRNAPNAERELVSLWACLPNDLFGKLVADAMYRLDDLALARCKTELATKAHHVCIYDAVGCLD